VYSVQQVNGLYAHIRGKRVFISDYHTTHTVSLYAMAHSILSALAPDVHINSTPSTSYRCIDISNATIKKRKNGQIYMNALHMGRLVFLKTTSDPVVKLKYIIEAIIHHLLKNDSPGCVPILEFIGKTSDDTLVLCSEQLIIPSISTWVQTLQSRNKSTRLRRMLLRVCRAFIIVQRDAHFTHRDCHTGNVYYDETKQKIQLIDFDWSCIHWRSSIISVPRFLYDTTRDTYGNNYSVDMCIFMRNLGKIVRGAPEFMELVWKPIMRRYEDETKNMIEKFRTEINAINDTIRNNETLLVQYPENSLQYRSQIKHWGEIKSREEHHLVCAMQLYKLSTKDGSVKGEYAHKYGIERSKANFDYRMGYFEWDTMTPRAIELYISKL